MRSPRLLAATSAAVLLACGGSSRPSAAPPAQALVPDVPRWRGGCFVEGDAGKIVNGSPSWDVVVYGKPCGGGTGGLAYLDAFDPVAGTGDVTVLPSTAGAAPIVVGRRGGAGGIVPGGAGVRVDAGATRLLTLQNVGFVTGDLVAVDLAAPTAPPRVLGTGVRVLNYDFLPSGDVLFVGNYKPETREGDLFAAGGAAPLPIASRISRAEFQMYRLDPARAKVAYLQAWTETGGGDLWVRTVSPAVGEPTLVGRAVERMAWTDAGELVWAERLPTGNATLRVAAGGDPAGARTVATDVRSWTVSGATIAAVTRWSVLSGAGDLVARDGAVLATGVAAELGAGPDAPGGAPLAFVEPGAADRGSGSLGVVVAGAVRRAVDDRVAPRAGFSFSGGRLLAYARDWSDPFASGSASPQPGIAGEVRAVALPDGAPFTIAAQGSMQWIAWAPGGALVAALAAFDPAANRGRLEVRRTGDGALVSAIDAVAPTWFGFGSDGATLAAIRGWDDALQRGELVVQGTDFAAPPRPVATDVTWFATPSGERVLYGVRGGGRDGLWLR